MVRSLILLLAPCMLRTHVVSMFCYNPQLPIAPSSPTPSRGPVDTPPEDRGSFDEELANMTPDERVAYLKEYDDSDKHDEPKKGGLIEKLIARGNKRTEEQLEREHAERLAAQGSTATATAGQNPVIR
jgi:hypothetical protein